MNSLALELNAILDNTVASAFFTDIGKEMFFPKGIVAQSAEANKHANKLNATVGMACENKKPMIMPQIQKLIPSMTASEIVSYAPTAGIAGLGELWLEDMRRKNPAIEKGGTSLPVVSAGLTHALSLCAEMFSDENCNVIIPDMFWGNYRLIFEQRRKSKILPFTFFNDDFQFNIKAFDEAITKSCSEKRNPIILLNFPNNPSGYSPTTQEAREIVACLQSHAEKGNKLLVILDDAYFGFFYEDDIFPYSLFSQLYNAHPNILAIKIDGATKELYAWGLRVGFITVGAASWTTEQYDAIKKKFMGMIRSSISNVCNLSQQLMFTLLNDGSYVSDTEQRFALMQKRYRLTKDIVSRYQKKTDRPLHPLPFNSGYFMTFRCQNENAEAIRLALLDRGTGIIAIQNKLIRIAFSSVDLDKLEELFTEIFLVADSLS